MPSLGSHLASAYGLADRLGHPHIDADRGAYYLGSTAPDIRVLLKVDRRHTHFFDLENFEAQDSVAQMFEQHPHLGEAAGLDPGTRAFVAGYLTHLLMDEHYIQTIYRRFFGERSTLGGDLWANILDRALQYEMNRRELEDEAALGEIRTAIDATEAAIAVGFIESRLWPEWRDFTRGITHQRPDWERFPQVMQIPPAPRRLQRGGDRSRRGQPARARPAGTRPRRRAPRRPLHRGGDRAGRRAPPRIPPAALMPALRIVEGAEAARASVLQRQPLGDPVLPEAVRTTIRETFDADLSAAVVVARIIARVRAEGDAAVRRFSERFDGSAEAPFEVTREEIDAAFAETPRELLESLQVAAGRVKRFHERQLAHGPRSFLEDGVGMTVRPIAHAGIYMAGNVAVLPSSVLHTAIPGLVAGVPNRIGVTAARPDGSVHPLKLVAAKLAGIQRIFRASARRRSRRWRSAPRRSPASTRSSGPATSS